MEWCVLTFVLRLCMCLRKILKLFVWVIIRNKVNSLQFLPLEGKKAYSETECACVDVWAHAQCNAACASFEANCSRSLGVSKPNTSWYNIYLTSSYRWYFSFSVSLACLLKVIFFLVELLLNVQHFVHYLCKNRCTESESTSKQYAPISSALFFLLSHSIFNFSCLLSLLCSHCTRSSYGSHLAQRAAYNFYPASLCVQGKVNLSAERKEKNDPVFFSFVKFKGNRKFFFSCFWWIVRVDPVFLL